MFDRIIITDEWKIKHPTMSTSRIEKAPTYLRAELETETARGATSLGAKAAVDVAITALTARENFMVSAY